MLIDRLGPAASCHTRLLTPADLGDLQALFERSADYFQVATGRPPLPDEAARAFVGGPPAKSVIDKRTIGVYEGNGRLVGVLDALTGWPEADVWTMGMLLLEPALRGQGLGGAVLAAYERWAGSQGARRWRTALVAHHTRGISFLERAGYQRENTISDYDAGGLRTPVIFLGKGG